MKAPANSPVTTLAQGALRRAGTDLAVATAERIRVIREARAVGLSFEQIGAELGITEAGARGLLRRHPERTS